MYTFNWCIFLVPPNLEQALVTLTLLGNFLQFGFGCVSSWLCSGEIPIARMPLKWSIRPAASHLEAHSVLLPFTGGSSVDCLVNTMSGLAGVQALFFPLQLTSSVGDALRHACILLLMRPTPPCSVSVDDFSPDQPCAGSYCGRWAP